MELIDLLPKVAEYGAVGILSLALYLIARMYLPHFVVLADALKALPAALQALTEQVKDIESGLDDVREELAVIKDRLPRPERAAAIREFLAQKAAGAGD